MKQKRHDIYPFVVFGFGAEKYAKNVPLLPKGNDEMSSRAIQKWKSKKDT